jgi:hypothetical protein
VNSLTNSEKQLIKKSCDSQKGAGRQGIWIVLNLVLGLIGVILIVAVSVSDKREGEITSSEFRKVIGFSVLLIGFFVLIWISDRNARKAHSTIAKLYKSSQCPNCGENVTRNERRD